MSKMKKEDIFVSGMKLQNGESVMMVCSKDKFRYNLSLMKEMAQELSDSSGNRCIILPRDLDYKKVSEKDSIEIFTILGDRGVMITPKK